MQNENNKEVLKNQISKLIGSFFGLGYAPQAPGTFGALGGCLVYVMINLFAKDAPHLVQFILFILIVSFYVLGVWSTNELEKEWGKDPSKIVVDEAVGQWITLLFVPFSYIWLFTGLVLFRFFDISKILGIRKAEALPRGTGVMMDDVLAGVYACAVLNIIVRFAGS